MKRHGPKQATKYKYFPRAELNNLQQNKLRKMAPRRGKEVLQSLSMINIRRTHLHLALLMLLALNFVDTPIVKAEIWCWLTSDST